MSCVFSHYGICVSDIEASARFYVDGLGVYCSDPDGTRVELMHLPSPPAAPTQGARRLPCTIC